MIIRDINETDKYFNEYIIIQKKRIQEFEEIFNELNDASKIEECNLYLRDYLIDLFYAQYSLGDSKDSIMTTFDEYLNRLFNSSNISYFEYINALSIAITFEYSDETILKIKSVYGKEDYMADILTNHTSNLSIDDLKFSEYYRPFTAFLCDEMSRDDFISYVENEWYESCKELAFYGAYERKDETYVGYWCWLASACLKIKGYSIEDNAGRYIPYID